MALARSGTTLMIETNPEISKTSRIEAFSPQSAKAPLGRTQALARDQDDTQASTADVVEPGEVQDDGPLAAVDPGHKQVLQGLGGGTVEPPLRLHDPDPTRMLFPRRS